MVMASLSLREDYWETLELEERDIETLYNQLLESEMPMTSRELIEILVQERIQSEKLQIEQQRSSGGDLYRPADTYQVDQSLVFPALSWRKARVIDVRPGRNPDVGNFDVIKVSFEDGEEREYAAGLEQHKLNDMPALEIEDENLDERYVLDSYEDDLVEVLEENLETNPDFVRIAGRWFPRALLVDINIGHLNLAEAVLDMAGGGPLPTHDLLEQIEISANVNPKLLEFSMDLALQEDERFDEVGSAGKVLWFLQKLEPPEVLSPPLFLRYAGMDYDRSLLTEDMLALERELDDELSPLEEKDTHLDEVEVRLIFPHWRAGTMPLSSRVRHLFPTAYEAPRIRFDLVDGETGDRFPAWVVREKRYVFGLREWYEENNLQPGSILNVQRGRQPGEVVINIDSRRTSREWIRTVLVGSDGGLVYAMLKQNVSSRVDDRMVIAVPDVDALDQVWEIMNKERPPFERVVVNTVKELAKLNPQGHVHASELYAALNIVRRVPPGPLFALLASRPWFAHVGDLHFRFVDSEPA
ncbi:MAG: hypothetical protein ACWGO1_02875 [Anaerolineales bacterium]